MIILSTTNEGFRYDARRSNGSDGPLPPIVSISLMMKHKETITI